MADTTEETKLKIIQSAKIEFLDKGFTNTSLRTIASNAGLTTGAMYRHFKDKDALFCALVDEVIENTKKLIDSCGVDFHTSSKDGGIGKEHFLEESEITLHFLDYVYEHFDEFNLLITKSSGSTHEHFIDEISDMYTETCVKVVKHLQKLHGSKKSINKMAMHLLASTMINAFAEIVTHKITKKEAKAFLINVQEFFHFGFMHMLGLPCE